MTKVKQKKSFGFTGFNSNVGKTFTGLASFVIIKRAEESHCSKDSSGKLSCFVENPQKL